MGAYPSYQREVPSREQLRPARPPQLASVAAIADTAKDDAGSGMAACSAAVDRLVDLLVERVAAAVAARLGHGTNDEEWFDCRHAADYLGVHRDTLRKLAAERAIPSEQDGPGCKLYFRRSDLDVWRRSGGRPRHIQARLASVA
jgi:excisionase family DNA binding protein